jgi:hypothetical protein
MEMLQKNLKFCGLIGFIVILSLGVLGCASIIKGGNQTLSFKSTPPEAKLKVYDRKGEMIISGSTPYVATLKRGSGYFKSAKYRVVVEKEGYQPKEFQIDGSINGWYLGGNLIFGGLIGYLIVDPATGAMWTLTPDEINAVLPSGVSFLEQNEGLMIILSEKIPENLLHEMKPINLPQ